jgi:hypothetical protein
MRLTELCLASNTANVTLDLDAITYFYQDGSNTVVATGNTVLHIGMAYEDFKELVLLEKVNRHDLKTRCDMEEFFEDTDSPLPKYDKSYIAQGINNPFLAARNKLDNSKVDGH